MGRRKKKDSNKAEETTSEEQETSTPEEEQAPIPEPEASEELTAEETPTQEPEAPAEEPTPEDVPEPPAEEEEEFTEAPPEETLEEEQVMETEQPTVEETTVESVPEEPPVQSVPEEPPVQSVPEEPPVQSVPEEPPVQSVPEEPPVEEEVPEQEIPEAVTAEKLEETVKELDIEEPTQDIPDATPVAPDRDEDFDDFLEVDRPPSQVPQAAYVPQEAIPVAAQPEDEFIEASVVVEETIEATVVEETPAEPVQAQEVKNMAQPAAPRRMKRIPTYIRGLDQRMQGGVPEGHIVLVCGAAGSMKSSVTFSILYNDILKTQSRSIYLSLEQTRESLLSHMENLGYQVTSNPVVNDNLAVIDLTMLRKEMKNIAPDKDVNWWDALITQLKFRKNLGFNMLVLDSLDALYALGRLDNPRDELFHFFEQLRELDTTVFLISEVGAGKTGYGKYGVEDFLSDGIIHLQLEKERRNVERFISVVKMRGTKHDMHYFPLLVDGHGFEIVTR